MPLTDTRIKTAKKATGPVKLTDGGGLYLEVRPTGAKLWRMRYRIAGKENLYALGAYAADVPAGESEVEAAARRRGGEFTLSEARLERDRCRRLVKQGIHPSHDRAAQKATTILEGTNTFKSIATEWIEANKARWSDRYRKRIEEFLAADVYPYIGTLPVRSITAAKMLETMQRMHKRSPSVAHKVNNWCSSIFRFAVVTLRADGDPTNALRGGLSRPRVRHHPPLDRRGIATFLSALATDTSSPITSAAMRLLLLTFVRTIELRTAEWDHIDWDGAVWRIPAERMKMREGHIVPLSEQAIELLRELQKRTENRRWLFPNVRRPKTYMAGTTLHRVTVRLGYEGRFTPHGFRATASTILNEAGFRADVIERQLAHAPRNQVRAAYNQAEYLPERRQMMQAWADLIDADVAKVVPIKAQTKQAKE